MVYIAQQSFGFGEVDPNIRAQYESAPYQRGCQTLENAFLSDTGSALKRWGSVTLTTDSGQYRAFQFINGYNEHYLIANTLHSSGNYSGYQILKHGVVLNTYYNSNQTDTTEYVRDIASDGTRCFVLTTDGIYIHQIEANSDNRVKLDTYAFDLITSRPSLSIQIVDATTNSAGSPTDISQYDEKILKFPRSYFEPAEEGDLYKINPSPTDTSNKPRFISLNSRNWRVTDSTVYTDHTSPNYPYKSPTEFFVEPAVSRNVNMAHNWHNVVSRQKLAEDPFTIHDVGDTAKYRKARIFFNGADTLTTETPTSGGASTSSDKWYVTQSSAITSEFIQSGDYIGVRQTGSDSSTTPTSYSYTFHWWPKDEEHVTSGKTFELSGTSDYRYQLQFGYSNDGTNNSLFTYRSQQGAGQQDYVALPADDTDVLDWSGPYRNWMQIGSPITTGTASISNVIGSASWDQIYRDEDTSTVSLSSVCSSFNDDHKKALTQGAVGKFDYYIGEVKFNTVYFYVGKKSFYPNPVNTDDPEIVLCWGGNQQGTTNTDRVRAYETSSNTADNSLITETIIMSLASSDGVCADGLPVPKLSTNDYLVRTRDTGDVDRVGIVGNSKHQTTINSYIPTWTSGAISSVTTVSTKVNCTGVIGDAFPAKDSSVFRISKLEDGTLINRPDYQPGTAYWDLTGKAFSPETASGQDATKLIWVNNVEYHQSRVFLAGFTPSEHLNVLKDAQVLGLTIISSKSGDTQDFETGPNSGDGLSFIVTSKQGGAIQWLKSMFNQLFLGTESEEFVISDVPIIPTSINISLQSAYGSEPGAGAVIFDSSIAYISTDGKSIRLLDFNERSNRFESTDILQFAKHLVKTDRVTRIDVVHTGTPFLFALTENGKLHCFTSKPKNNVYGWSQWSSPSLGNFNDIVGTADSSGNPALYARVAGLNSGRGSVLITTDHDRLDYLVDNAYEVTPSTESPNSATVSAFADQTVSVVLKKTDGTVVYLGDFTANSSGEVTFDQVENASKLILGYPFTMRMAPNIPEVMVPGKGSTVGREKNISRLRVLFNQARGAVAAGYDVMPVPKQTIHANVADAPGFYSIPVVGAYGPQPTIYIQQSTPYGFEVSGYNAEYDFGD